MHTDIKKAWANGELVQYRLYAGHPWRDWGQNNALDLNNAVLWRVAPKTININGHSVPAPLRSFDGVGEYWYADVNTGWPADFKVVPDDADIRWLSFGLCHATREAAQAHIDALLSFTRTDA